MANESKNHPKIQVHYNTEILETKGVDFLTSARFINQKEQREWEYQTEDSETFGIFVFAGDVPATEIRKGVVNLDEYGYIITDLNQQTNPPAELAGGFLLSFD